MQISFFLRTTANAISSPNLGCFTENVTTLDSFNLKNISFIKIDVEGYELNLLKGAFNTIEKNKPLIFIEKKKDYDDLKNFLYDLNYDIIEEFEKDILFKAK